MHGTFSVAYVYLKALASRFDLGLQASRSVLSYLLSFVSLLSCYHLLDHKQWILFLEGNIQISSLSAIIGNTKQKLHLVGHHIRYKFLENVCIFVCK